MINKNLLPVWIAASEMVQYAPRATRRILVVDDDEFIRLINAEVLLEAGYQVDMAEDGAVAWEKLQTGNYDLLVTDNDMPNVTGVELLRKIHTAGMTMPAIMVTGAYPQVQFSRSPWLQPQAVLLKPYIFANLLGNVQRLLDSRELALGNDPASENWVAEPAVLELQPC